MSKSDSNDEEDFIGTRVSSTTKRHAKMRAAQVGEPTLSDYIRRLIEDDLDDAELPELE